jgi:hypothetical protein
MPNVLVTMYKDSGNYVYPSGVQKAVSVSSTIFSVERVYTAPDLHDDCVDTPAPYINCLKIQDPVLGNIWIGGDEISFTQLIAQAVDGPTGGDIITKELLIGTDIPEGNTLVATWLHNVKIIGDITLANTPLSNVPFNPDYSATLGSLDFSATPLVSGSYLVITYQAL